ncbi:MAG: sigma-70 family RNA polymerase sigma factor [Candidatus Riflebacteria bacterium]|nr:sigma-70 family RNA polymerase sigma factor [Candidatus Riflebacteria bacterium]
MPALPDATLISRVRAGDADAFEGLVTRYKGLVYSTVARILADRDAAGDVMQEAFVKAYGAVGGLQDPGAFKAWLLRIATNEALRHLREKRPELLSDEAPAASQSAWQRGVGSVEDAISRRVTGQRIESGLARLPAIYRATLVMRFYGQLPYKDIAQSLGITLANVKFRIHHGTRLLRGILSADGD